MLIETVYTYFHVYENKLTPFIYFSSVEQVHSIYRPITDKLLRDMSQCVEDLLCVE